MDLYRAKTLARRVCSYEEQSEALLLASELSALAEALLEAADEYDDEDEEREDAPWADPDYDYSESGPRRA